MALAGRSGTLDIRADRSPILTKGYSFDQSGLPHSRKSATNDFQAPPRSSSFELHRLRSSFTNLKGALNRPRPELIHDVEPTVYLVIHNAEAQRVGISWTITLRMPESLDYLFDIVPNRKPQRGFHVREERYPNAAVHGKSFKATVKIGTIPNDSALAVQHVVQRFKSQKLDVNKPLGMSIIWVTDVLGKLERTGLLKLEKGANLKIEKQIGALENELRST